MNVSRFLVCAIALCAGWSAAWARPEVNAFLNKPVHSTDELIRQMRSDPQVLKRFEAHFKMDKEQLTEYFKDLRLISIPKGRHYLTFNIDNKGVIRRKKLWYPYGTRVFVDRNGVPVLKRSCGNPMSFGPQGLQRVAFEGERKQVILPEAPISESEYGFAPEPILLVALPGETIEEETPTAEPGPGPAAAPPVGPAPAAPFIPAVAALNPWPWLGGGIVGGLLINPGSGGGGGVPIPEPATMAALAIGAAGILRRRQR